jgi:hypothetical protein
MPVLQENGGHVVMRPYSGLEIPSTEWTSLEYSTPPTDPTTWFAPLATATGANILRGFWDFGKPDLDGIWTSNADRAPGLVRYVDSLGNRFGRIQIIRQEPTSIREARWGLHLDDNNLLLDSETVFHSGYHTGPDRRYALIVSIESTDHLDDWVRSQLP